ncbi:hypothetical protein RYZ26_05990 [Terasakiella sp. A23]|uniref:hypothetical protein n=1 Tax=Terasakiella sp. FCG-A23 TaxID=3080561 RepID=UPI002953F464|nr:hypothetical protein [Terasakiella sp. A23]MDV7339133.1 hypothetical protein [Terasakiella sp. A23]
MMKRYTTPFFAALLVLTALCAANSQKAQAAELPNLMVMGEDNDRDAIPRDSRVFRRVLNELAGELNADGFDVYDETAVSLDDFAQGRTRRSDAELIDIARSITRPPIDIVVLFDIYASAERLDYTTKVRTRLSGRLLDVHSGRRLGNFEVSSPRNFRAPVNCNRECIVETVGDNARLLARDMADVLLQKLSDEVDYGSYDDDRDHDYDSDRNDDRYGSSSTKDLARRGSDGCRGRVQDVYLNFQNFTEQEMLDMEDVILAKFSCYVDHRPAASHGRTHEYVYKTRLHTNKMKRNLVRALEYLGMSGRVRYQGKEFTVAKVNKRRSRYYNDGSKW